MNEKKTVQNTVKHMPIKMHIYRQKLLISILLAFVKNNEYEKWPIRNWSKFILLKNIIL